MSLASRLPRFYYGWMVVAVSALVLLVMAGNRRRVAVGVAAVS